MTQLNISLVQHSIQEGRIQKNIEHVEELLKSVPDNTDLLVFPELFLTGYPYSRFENCAHELHHSPVVSFLAETSRFHKTWITGGSFIEKTDTGFYNSMPLFDPEGNIVVLYRKINLFSPMSEDQYFTSGDAIVTAETAIGSVGLSLCYDIRFPELFRLMVLKGAKIIVVAAEFPEPRLDHWLTLLKSRAIENQIYVVAVNRCKGNRLYTFLGNSVVIDPWGEVLVNAGNEEGIFSACIDTSFVDEVRSNIPTFKDTREDYFNTVFLRS